MKKLLKRTKFEIKDISDFFPFKRPIRALLIAQKPH